MLRARAAACLAVGLALLAPAPGAPQGTMVLHTTTFRPNGTMPLSTVYNGDGCTGDDRSPELSWSGAPAATRGFALTMVDPDVPVHGGWWHWIRYAIPPGTHELPANAGDQSLNQRGPGLDAMNTYLENAYGGPCPPQGDHAHHYVFTLYALNVEAPAGINPRSTGPQVLGAIAGHVLAKAELVGRYGR